VSALLLPDTWFKETEMRLYDVIGRILEVDPETLSEDSNAQNTMRWDSLRHIEVIMAVESAYHVRFTMPELANLQRLGDIRSLLVEKGAQVDEIDGVVTDADQTAAVA